VASGILSPAIYGRGQAVVKATNILTSPKAVLAACEELGEAMTGIDVRQL